MSKYIYKNIKNILNDNDVLDECNDIELREIKFWLNEPLFDLLGTINYNAVVKMIEKGYITIKE